METAAVDSTPGTTTETSSAPASSPTSSPSQPSTPSSTRPTSFQDAFARLDAAQSPTAAPEGPATTAQPAPDPNATPDPSATQGPIPFAVHKTALDNARTKAANEAIQSYRQQYGWAEQIPQKTLQDFSHIANRMSQNPAAFLENYFQEAANHPQHGPAVRSWAARVLGSRSSQAQTPDLTPDVQIVGPDGQVSGSTFSAERVQAIVQHAVADAIGKHVTPLQQAESQRQQQARQQAAQQQQQQIAQQLDAAVDTTIADLAELLDLTKDTPKETSDALYAEINALLAQDPNLTPHRAAMQVRKTRIVPGLQSKATQNALDIIHQKAAGNTAGSGGSAAPITRPKNEKELAAFMRARDR